MAAATEDCELVVRLGAAVTEDVIICYPLRSLSAQSVFQLKLFNS